MRELTIGKTRGLQQLSTSRGIFTVCAVDHRRSLRRVMNSADPGAVTYDEMMSFKMDVCESLGPVSGSVQLDPIYSASQAIASSKISGKTGLLISLDAASYDFYVEDDKPDEFLIDWDVEKVRAMGASAVMIPLYYRPDLPRIASKQMETLNKIAYNCHKADIALCVSPKNYIVPELERDQWEWARKKPDLAIETVRQLSLLPVDLLEIEFPADITFDQDEETLFYICHHLNEASKVSWILSSGGTGFNLFTKQLELACKAGASGFVAGRVLWEEAAALPGGKQRGDWLRSEASYRLNHLIRIAEKFAAPWNQRVKSTNNYMLPDMADDWLRNYRKFRINADEEKAATPLSHPKDVF